MLCSSNISRIFIIRDLSKNFNPCRLKHMRTSTVVPNSLRCWESCWVVDCLLSGSVRNCVRRRGSYINPTFRKAVFQVVPLSHRRQQRQSMKKRNMLCAGTPQGTTINAAIRLMDDICAHGFFKRLSLTSGLTVEVTSTRSLDPFSPACGPVEGSSKQKPVVLGQGTRS